MSDLFKDRYKLGLFMASLFLVGIIASIYQIYRLPKALSLQETYHPALFNVYVIVGITFMIGVFTVWSSLNYKNEVIVFRDKQADTENKDKELQASEQLFISLEPLMENLRSLTDETAIIEEGLQWICKTLEAGQGAFYQLKESNGKRTVELSAGYALNISENTVVSYEVGEGLIGQAAAGGQTLYVDDVPQGYVKIFSGLGSASPRYLIIMALKQRDRVIGIMEIALFKPLGTQQRKFAEECVQMIADKISGK